MSEKALVQLKEFQVSWESLRKIPDDHLAAIAVLSFAVSESNALAKIYLTQSHKMTNEKAIDSALKIHQFLIIRIWSSKLFEAVEFLRLGGRKTGTTDAKLLELASSALKDFETIADGEGYEVARDIRHEATNHYSFSAARKNLATVHNGADCNMYIHQQSGNCFYPFGEEVMFHARLNRKWKNIQEKSRRDRLFKEWLDWNIAADKWLAETHAHFTKSLIFDHLGRNSLRETSYWIPEELVGDYNSNMSPLFLRRDEK